LPDGKQIAFSAAHQEPVAGTIDGTPKGGTFVVNVDGSGRKRILKKADRARVSWALADPACWATLVDPALTHPLAFEGNAGTEDRSFRRMSTERLLTPSRQRTST